jgi:hypothetical protein
MFYAGGIVFFQNLRFVWGERVRAVSGVLIALVLIALVLIALAFIALASGCGILRCGGTAVYGVAISVCA